MEKTIKDRIKRIQARIGVKADGIIGSATLTALENELFKDTPAVSKDTGFSLTVSAKGIKQLVKHEISSATYYAKFLSHPVWPGGQSGITIGIGYDLGYHTRSQIHKDWMGKLPDMAVEKLTVVSGLKEGAARQVLDGVQDITIPLETARQVFFESTLVRFAAITVQTWPGVEQLFPDAQAALLSLIYNRGASLKGASRLEMAAVKPLVEAQDYDGISRQILEMKRLWENKGLDGLLKRREDEARLVRLSDHEYDPSELIRI